MPGVARPAQTHAAQWRHALRGNETASTATVVKHQERILRDRNRTTTPRPTSKTAPAQAFGARPSYPLDAITGSHQLTCRDFPHPVVHTTTRHRYAVRDQPPLTPCRQCDPTRTRNNPAHQGRGCRNTSRHAERSTIIAAPATRSTYGHGSAYTARSSDSRSGQRRAPVRPPYAQHPA